MSAATLVLLGWGLGRPALWMDESASALAARRSWPNLRVLLHGPEAPLVPYYAVLKVLSGAATHLGSIVTAHPEIVSRWPSAAGVALAGGVLVGWLCRTSTTPAAVATGAGFLLIGGVSRYGQEARPYGLTVLLAVLAMLAWSRAVHGSRRWIAVYALSIAALVAIQPLAGALVAAQLVSSVAVVPRGRRLSAVARTMAGAAAGLLLASPLLLESVRNGRGSGHFPPLTPHNFLITFLPLIAADADPVRLALTLPVLILALLAVLGITRIRSPRYQFAARVGASWAVMPLVALLPAVLLRPNLLLGRYLMFTIPGWAILAGLGMVTAGELVARATAGRLPRARPRAMALTMAVLIGATGVLQLPGLRFIRTATGHGEDIRPALALADSAAYRGLPIVITDGLRASELVVYHAADAPRMVNSRAQSDRSVVWPLTVPASGRWAAVAGAPSFLVLQRHLDGVPCATPGDLTSDQGVAFCLRVTWLRQPYRVVTSYVRPQQWTFTLLTAVPAAPAPPAD